MNKFKSRSERNVHEWPMCADDKVGLRVLVDESGAGLEPLPLALLCLQAVRDQTRGSRFQNYPELIQTSH